MDQIHVVRHKVLVEGLSIRKVAKQMGVARNTVRRYLTDTALVERQSPERKCPVTDAVRPRLHELLAEAPRCDGRQAATDEHEAARAAGGRGLQDQRAHGAW